MILKNDTNRYHLYYLFLNNFRNDKYDGLSHVAEHAFLVLRDINFSFIAKGYTCASHVCLYFGSKSLTDLEKIDQIVMNGETITNESVREAKEQVIEEIQQLHDKTQRFEELVSFITEGRVNRSALGNSVEVAKIRREDIEIWFEEKKHSGQVYRFLYRDAHRMISSSLDSGSRLSTGRGAEIGCPQCADSFLYTVSPNEASTVQIYFRVYDLFTKSAAIRKAFYEFCIQRELADNLGIEVSVADNFFDVEERYVRMDFGVDSKSTVKNMIAKIRTVINSIDENEVKRYFSEFKTHLMKIMDRAEYNSEVMNSIKNMILYSMPQVTLEDVKEFEYAQLDEFPKERITSAPLKIVIT